MAARHRGLWAPRRRHATRQIAHANLNAVRVSGIAMRAAIEAAAETA